jgi:hypothetical protein
MNRSGEACAKASGLAKKQFIQTLIMWCDVWPVMAKFVLICQQKTPIFYQLCRTTVKC